MGDLKLNDAFIERNLLNTCKVGVGELQPNNTFHTTHTQNSTSGPTNRSGEVHHYEDESVVAAHSIIPPHILSMESYSPFLENVMAFEEICTKDMTVKSDVSKSWSPVVSRGTKDGSDCVYTITDPYEPYQSMCKPRTLYGVCANSRRTELMVSAKVAEAVPRLWHSPSDKHDDEFTELWNKVQKSAQHGTSKIPKQSCKVAKFSALDDSILSSCKYFASGNGRLTEDHPGVSLKTNKHDSTHEALSDTELYMQPTHHSKLMLASEDRHGKEQSTVKHTSRSGGQETSNCSSLLKHSMFPGTGELVREASQSFLVNNESVVNKAERSTNDLSPSLHSDQIIDGVKVVDSMVCGGTSDITDVCMTDSEDDCSLKCRKGLGEQELPMDCKSVSSDTVDLQSLTSDVEIDIMHPWKRYPEHSKKSCDPSANIEFTPAWNMKKAKQTCKRLQPPPELELDEFLSSSDSSETDSSTSLPGPLCFTDEGIGLPKHNKKIKLELNNSPKQARGRRTLINNSTTKVKQHLGFLCLLCRKSFLSINTLKSHIKSCHTDQRAQAYFPYQEVVCVSCRSDYLMCLYCGRKYFSVKRIVQHTQRHKRKGDFFCTLCRERRLSENRFHLYFHVFLSPRCSTCELNIEASQKNSHFEDSDEASCSPISRLEDGDDASYSPNPCLKDSNDASRSPNAAVEPEPCMASTTSDTYLSCSKPDIFIPETDDDSSEDDINWDPVVLIERLPKRVLKFGGAFVRSYGGRWEMLTHEPPNEAMTAQWGLNDISHFSFPHIAAQAATTYLSPRTNDESDKYAPSHAIRRSKKTVSSYTGDDVPSTDESFSCEVCGEEFLDSGLLNSHMIKEHLNVDEDSDSQSDTINQSSYTCELCLMQFSNLEMFVDHMKTHDGAIRFTCVACKAEFSSETAFEKHLSEHGTDYDTKESKIDQNFKCEFCPFSTPNKEHHRTHEDYECTVKMFLCLICKQRFMTCENLDDHKKIHAGSHKTASCGGVGKIDRSESPVVNMKTKSGLKQRKKAKRSLKRGRHKCEHCGCVFQAESDYLKHLESRHLVDIDHPNKTHTCHKCGQNFAYRQSLWVHIRTHYSETVTCEKCTQTFSGRTIHKHTCIPQRNDTN